MQQKTDNPQPQNTADIARETFRRLATQRIAPTPDAYRAIYNEVAGIASEFNAELVLTRLADTLARTNGDVADFGRRLNHALTSKDWPAYHKGLDQLIEKHLSSGPAVTTTAAMTVSDLSIHQPAPTRLLSELLARTLSYAIPALLPAASTLADESNALGNAVKQAQSEPALNDIAAKLKQLCFRIELQSGDTAEQHELLLRLIKLLLDNVGELLDDDCWMHGQIQMVQNLIAGPINYRDLEDATRSLKEVIYKQGVLKHSLSEAKGTLKKMMSTFIERLGVVAENSGEYHQKIDLYTKKISQTEDIDVLHSILNEVLRETRIVQTEALRSRDEMIAARQEVHDAESRILQLESKLEQMSELVREDQLTGSLNRRGLDDVFERELARSKRRHAPLCAAMLDLDDFKKLNDTHGHSAGDEALIHLVRVAKETIRPMDIIARFGGEEFVILFPETTVHDASVVLTRLQRALTKHFFLHENERLLITFSAGVALCAANEEPAAALKRADEAMYKAKKAGKNRVVSAE
jgi:diguanylate cyclase